jgi:hypothetical protein
MMFTPTVLLEILLLVAASDSGAAVRRLGLEAQLRAALSATASSQVRDVTDSCDLRDREVRRIVLDSITRDGAATFEGLRWLSRDLDELRGSLLRALGSSGDERALEWIVAQLDDPALVDDALQELTRFGRTTPEPLAGIARARAAEHLTALSPNRRRLARAVAVALDCEEAIPILIDQLVDADTFEHDQISAALHALSGVRPGSDDEAWQRWLETELEWSAVHAATALDALHSNDPAAVVRAVQSLSGRTYQRTRWSLAIAELLELEQPLAVRRQVCLALGRLRSLAARGALEAAAASDPSPEIQQLAASVLARLGSTRRSG